ncbi:MAG: hypothetical protein AABY22_06375 [Nanoarchaeota archaeon]
MKIFSLTKIEKLKLIGLCVKSVTAIIGGSLILIEGYPYVSLSILALGAIANEIVSFIKEKENKLLVTNENENHSP